MSNAPKIEPLTPEQRAQMVGELADFRLRAEHGLLRRLATEVEHGQLYRETFEALAALSASEGSVLGSALARALAPTKRRPR